MKNQIREWLIIIILGIFSITMSVGYKTAKGDYDEVVGTLKQCQVESEIEIRNHRYCSVGLERTLIKNDQCQIDLKEQRAEWLWIREQLVICNAENDGLKFVIDKGVFDSSSACYTAQDKVLVFLNQALKNMDSFYCSEVLRTDEVACNIIDARFVVIENLELMRNGCYPE